MMHNPSTVVIAGASAGVGRAAARAFGELGCNVGLIARNRERLEHAKAEIEAAGGRALVLPADVAEPDALEHAADRVEAELGPIDVWVNVAMVTVVGPIDVIRPEEFRRVTEVTYLGQVYGAKAALRHMRPRDQGTIVLVGSALAYRGIPLQAPYCAAKFAVRGFADSLRSELIHDGSGIRVSMVQLPGLNTPQFDWARNYMPRRLQPVPPVYQPEVAAAAIVRAAQEAPRELWLGTSTMKVIVGNAVAPELLDRMLSEQAYSGQQTDEPAEDRPDNLYDPVPGDFGAHGRFDEGASGRGVELSAAAVRLGLAGVALGLGLGALALVRRQLPYRA